MTEIIDKVIIEAKRIEQDALFSFKGCFNAADFWKKVHIWFGCCVAVTSAIAGIVIISDTERTLELFAAGMAILSSVLVAVTTALAPQKKANDFHQAGADYKYLRDRARLLHEAKIKTDIAPDKLISELTAMQKKSRKLSKNTPVIPNRAFKAARKGIESGEADYDI